MLVFGIQFDSLKKLDLPYKTLDLPQYHILFKIYSTVS